MWGGEWRGGGGGLNQASFDKNTFVVYLVGKCQWYAHHEEIQRAAHVMNNKESGKLLTSNGTMTAAAVVITSNCLALVSDMPHIDREHTLVLIYVHEQVIKSGIRQMREGERIGQNLLTS
jgi:hypothetical protein